MITVVNLMFLFTYMDSGWWSLMMTLIQCTQSMHLHTFECGIFICINNSQIETFHNLNLNYHIWCFKHWECAWIRGSSYSLSYETTIVRGCIPRAIWSLFCLINSCTAWSNIRAEYVWTSKTLKCMYTCSESRISRITYIHQHAITTLIKPSAHEHTVLIWG